jgi:hypothetical protein
MSQLLDDIQQRLVSFYRRESVRIYPYRRYLVLLTFLPVCCVLIVVLVWKQTGSEPPEILGNIIPVSILIGAGFWALACMCFWFHTQKGTLYVKSKLRDYFPVSPEGLAVFLTILFAIIPIILVACIILLLLCP